jgi:hypothetical protein
MRTTTTTKGIPKKTDPTYEERFFKLGFDILPNGDIINSQGKKMETEFIDEYERFNPRINGEKHIFTVHRVQAFKKFGKKKLFKKDIIVSHKDLDNTNNNFDNIILCTRSERMMMLPEAQRLASALHAASHNKVYDDVAVYADYLVTKSYKKTMTTFGIASKSTLSGIIKKHSRNKIEA